ncbi:hypothetical protein PM082_023871 [Marasmius tenuissimus]|nr:hypothetical protein PM082_023871 [Marasmius tenuissimus]
MVLIQKTYQIANDIKLFVTDTGAPPNSKDYTTLVIIHGFGFPGACFEPLQAQSQTEPSNLRVVALNRRDFAGSTPFSDAELEALRGDESLAQESHGNLGLHMLLFLRKFVEEEGVPPILANDEQRTQRSGGIVVMGWSMGSTFAIAPFANPRVVNADTYKVLEKYVKGLVLYDPAHSALGFPIPSNVDAKKLYTPWTDPAPKNPRQVFDKFVPFVCSRYQYEYAARGVDGDGFIPIPTVESLEKTGSLERTDDCIADSWSKEELGRLTDKEATFPERDDMSLLAHQTVLENATQKVLFDEQVAKILFPNLSITYLYAPHSLWMCVLAYMETRRRYDELATVLAIRPVKFIELKGADHFVHNTDPRGFLQTIGEALA